MSISVGKAFELAVSIVLRNKGVKLKTGDIIFYQFCTKNEIKNHPVWNSMFVNSEQAYLYYKDEHRALYLCDVGGNKITLRPQSINDISRYMKAVGVVD